MPKKKKTYLPGEKRPAGKQLDGRYRGKLKIGEDAEGKAVYKYASGRTKAELDDALEELRKAYIFGIDKVDRGILTSKHIEDWYAAYKEPHIAGSNARCYRTILDAHWLPEFGDQQIRSIRTIAIQRFLNDRAHFKASYMKKIIMVGKQFFKRAVMDGIIDRDPTMGIVVPECDEGSRRALTLAERKAVLGTISSEPNGIEVALLFYLGLRPGEALGLQWGDIDFKEKVVHIQRDIDFADTPDGLEDSLKNSSSDRRVPMPSEMIALLKSRKGLKDTYVIQSPVSGKWMRSSDQELLWDRLMRRAYDADHSIEFRQSICSHRGEDDVEHWIKRSVLTPYYLRHNYATMLHARGIDAVTASKWMGHKKATTMMEFYIHLDEAKEKIDVSLLDGVFDLTASK